MIYLILNLINLFKSIFFFTGSYSINVFPEPLSQEEESNYLDLLKDGDENARSKLIEHNLRLVAHIVKKYDTKEKNTDDLISIGTIGLIKGIDSFKNDKNTRLTTYVAKCIQNEILMYFRNNKKHANDVSLNDSIGFDKDGNEINLIDVLKSDEEDILTTLHNKDSVKTLINYLNILNAREREIIIKRYGLFNNEELTQKEISKELNISRSYVSRIEKRALLKIYKKFIKERKEY